MTLSAALSPVVSTRAPYTPKTPNLLAVWEKKQKHSVYSQVFDQYGRHAGNILKEKLLTRFGPSSKLVDKTQFISGKAFRSLSQGSVENNWAHTLT